MEKDLAKEFAYNLYYERTDDRFNEYADVFDACDIEDAFNEGKQSVIDNIPDLKWEECVGGYIAETNIFNYYIEINEYAKEKYTLIFPVENPICFLRIEEAKQAANKHYKRKLKKALGL